MTVVEPPTLFLKDRPVGGKLSVTEIARRVREQNLYEKLPEEEVQRLKQNLEVERLSKEYGKRTTPAQKVADAAQTLGRIQDEVSANFMWITVTHVFYS